MRRFRWLFVLTGLLLASNVQAQNALLEPFASEAEMEAYFRESLTRVPPRVLLPSPNVSAAPDSTPPVSRPRVPGGAVVMGRVVERGDAAGLPGVTVTLEGTNLGSVTDIDGNYVIYTDALSDTMRTRLRAELAGFNAEVQGVRVIPDATTVQNFVLHIRGLSEKREAIEIKGLIDNPPPGSHMGGMVSVQTSGVDEGGLVKVLGDYLVVLRRGRLFTVRVGGNRLEPVASADAFGTDIDPDGAWYNDLLLVGKTAVVMGYSYARGDTELVLHDIGSDGQIRYRSTYHLNLDGYVSSSDANWVIGGKLVFYAARNVFRTTNEASSSDILPSLRRWRAGGETDAFEPIATYRSVYRPAQPLGRGNGALHTVVACSVHDGELACSATAVFGLRSDRSYVSSTAVYVWASEWRRQSDERPKGVAYRLPLNGSRPGALGVEGEPVDRFSFLESDGHMNVLVTNDGAGQWMWGAERERDAVALFRAPLSAFGPGAKTAPAAWYTPLPSSGCSTRNRFVNDWLLYGEEDCYGSDDESRIPRGQRAYPLYAVQMRTGRVTALRIPNRVERIEAMGRDAMVAGLNGTDLLLTPVALGDSASVRPSYRIERATPGETRSHGFFYREDGLHEGVVGVPVRYRGGRFSSVPDGAASVVYLRNRNLRLTPYGALDAHPGRGADDGCRASCVDWYGNARPIFLGERVFALLGYELVEGRVRQGAVRETRRVSFAPRAEERTEQQP